MFNSKYVQLDSSKKTIVFWVNASFAIGGGHIARCLALADCAKTKDFQSIIITTESETSKHLNDGIPYILMSNNIKDVSKTLKHLMLKFNIRCLISDFNYHTNKNAKLKYHKYLDTVKKFGIYLFTFEVPEIDVYPADCIIIPYLGADTLRYKHVYEKKFLIGADFFILKDEFKNLQKNKEVSLNVNTIIISMGNSDPESISLKAIKAVLHINLGIHLDIILGSMNKLNEDFLQDQLKDYNGSWKIHRNIKNIATLMKKADLAICNNGLTRYELASLGIPTIFLSNSQKDTLFSDLFASFGCAHHLGWHKNLTSKEVANAVVSLIQDFNTRKNMSQKGKKLIDGDGVARVFKEIMIK